MHRDIKPENFLLTDETDAANLKVRSLAFPGWLRECAHCSPARLAAHLPAINPASKRAWFVHCVALCALPSEQACDFGLSDFFKPDQRFSALIGSAYYVVRRCAWRCCFTPDACFAACASG